MKKQDSILIFINAFYFLLTPQKVPLFCNICPNALASKVFALVPWTTPIWVNMYVLTQVKCFRGNQDLVVDYLVRVLNVISDNWSLCQILCAFKAFCECVNLKSVRISVWKMLHKCVLEYAHSVTRCCTGVTWCAWNVTWRYISCNRMCK